MRVRPMIRGVSILLLAPALAQGQSQPSVQIYSYSVPSPAPSAYTGYAPNGILLSYTDSVNGSWNMRYDSLNRLTSANGTAGAYQGLNLSMGYDSFGNRLNQTVSGSSAIPVPLSTSATYNSSNQASNMMYDAAGDVTADGTNSYLYDAEGRVCAVQSASSGAVTQYFYDAEGQRVAKANAGSFSCSLTTTAPTATYVLGPSGEQMTEFDGGGNWVHTNIFANGQLLATYDTQGVHFQINDPLGTRRVETDYAGNVQENCTSLPFGEQIAPCTTNPTEQFFTAKERDTESGNDYSGARYYASTMGRFLSPDPSGLAYANPANPQSLNLYGYVINNPLGFIDPSGLMIQCVITTTETSSTSGVTANRDGSYSMKATRTLRSTGQCHDDARDNQKKPEQSNATKKPPTVSHCLGVAAKDKGVSIGLDIIGSIPAVGNAASASAGIIRAGIAVDHAVTSPAFALSSGAYGAYGAVKAGPENPTDTLVGGASAGTGIGLTLADVSLEGTKAIPIVGNFVSVATLGWDGYEAYKTYQSCIAGR